MNKARDRRAAQAKARRAAKAKQRHEAIVAASRVVPQAASTMRTLTRSGVVVEVVKAAAEATGALRFPAIQITDPAAERGTRIPPHLIADFFKGTMEMVDCLAFNIGSDEGLGGKCVMRALAAYQAIRASGVQVRIGIGGVVARVGPHPRNDVVSFCGLGNVGCIDPRGNLFHCWLCYEDMIFDPSVGEWRTLDPVAAELEVLGKALPPVQWDVTLPRNWVKPASELAGAWRPNGEPDIGCAWYGPYCGNPQPAMAGVRALHQNIGQLIASVHTANFNRFAEAHGHGGAPDATVYPLQFRVHVAERAPAQQMQMK